MLALITHAPCFLIKDEGVLYLACCYAVARAKFYVRTHAVLCVVLSLALC